jgi:hypothetical protein
MSLLVAFEIVQMKDGQRQDDRTRRMLAGHFRTVNFEGIDGLVLMPGDSH